MGECDMPTFVVFCSTCDIVVVCTLIELNCLWILFRFLIKNIPPTGPVAYYGDAIYYVVNVCRCHCNVYKSCIQVTVSVM
jgi:hypothetical protein